MSGEIEVGGVKYKYSVSICGDNDKGMTQHVTVFNDEGCVGDKEDSAVYGLPLYHHPAGSMGGVARIIAHEIIGEYLRRKK